jgi:hypothetical protein
MEGMRAPVANALALSLFCFLMFLPPSIRSAAAFSLFLLSSLAFWFGVAFNFDAELPIRARLAITLLTFVAFAHLWFAAIVTQPTDKLVAWAILDFSTTLPVATIFHAIQTCTVHDPCSRADLWVDWTDDLSFEIVIVSTIVVSLLAIAAARAMARRRKVGYFIWLVIIALSTIGGLWMVLANGLISIDGAPLYHEEFGSPVWWSLCLPLNTPLLTT